MHKYLLLLLIISCTTVSSCSQNAPIITNFEDIKNEKTAQHTRVEGTSLYLTIPEEYKFIKELVRYGKEEKLYFQVMEFASSFIDWKQNMTKAKLEATGAKVDHYQYLTVNNQEGIYMEGPSKYPNETKIMLAFGDESKTVLILGVCKTDNSVGKKELQSIFRTTYYDKELSQSAFELANFELDEAKSGFVFNNKVANMYVFSPVGEDANREDYEGPVIMLSALPKMQETKLKETLLMIIERAELLEKATFQSKEIVKKKIASKDCLLLETTMQIQGIEVYTLQGILMGEHSNLLIYVTCANKNAEDYKSQIMKAINSISFKD